MDADMPRSRRRTHAEEEPENHERWLVSYADFITLLFAFFVVMYSLSSVNEGKYRVLSDSLVAAFRTLSISGAGHQQEGILPPLSVPVPMPVQTSKPVPKEEEDPAERQRRLVTRRMHNMAAEIRRMLEPLSQSGQVRVSEGAHGISVEINASVLFMTGEAALDTDALPPLQAVAQVLSAANLPVTVEGHTDSKPIHTFRFPSNWELSSARAASVVRLFIDSGVPSGQLTVVGYSDQRPIADNETPEGRARNRRVTILIESMFPETETPASPGVIASDDPMRSILPDETGNDAAETAQQPAGPAADSLNRRDGRISAAGG